MRTSPINRVIDHLRRAVLLPDGAGLGDGELLSSFIERHDETALAALVRRHGPMVWGVCRRLLSHHDAEDAFQATFIVLVRKAASIRSREMVGNWLYGVAHQTALLARRTAARRRAREVQVTEMPDTEAVQQDQWPELRPLLDEELSRLPEIYRAVIVLCELEGKSRKETACQLGVPEGTVAGRLARARVMLAKRLAQRGVVVSGGTLAAILSQNVASAGVPNVVVTSTIKVASLFAAGQAVATGAISVKVAALTEGVLKAMLFTKIKSVMAVVLLVAALVGGAGLMSATQGGEGPAKQNKKSDTVRISDANEGDGIIIDVSKSMADGGKRDGIKIDVSKSMANGIRRDGVEDEKPKKDAEKEDAKPAKAQGKLPKGPTPTQALVSIDKDGQLVVRTLDSSTEVIEKDINGKRVTTYYTVETPMRRYYKLENVKVHDTKGKAIDKKELPKLVKEDTPALVTKGGIAVDPLHLRLCKEGTLLFLLPPPEKEEEDKAEPAKGK
jgi:RNA polymerase sigma factor (sigma-70 family)